MAAKAEHATRSREWEGVPESRAFGTPAPTIERLTPRINDDWQAFDDFGMMILRAVALARSIAADVYRKGGDALCDEHLCIDVLIEKLSELYLTFQVIDEIGRRGPGSKAA